MTKKQEDELLRLACIYAERDQQALYEATKDCCKKDWGPPLKFVRQIRKYRLSRWGRTEAEKILEEAEECSIDEIKKRALQSAHKDCFGG